MIENKTYKILIKTNDNYRKDFGINDADYKQYVYVNFVTRDIKCYLHDGSYADPTIYNKNTDVSNPNIKRRYDEFMAIMMIICLADEYQPYFDRGMNIGNRILMRTLSWLNGFKIYQNMQMICQKKN